MSQNLVLAMAYCLWILVCGAFWLLRAALNYDLAQYGKGQDELTEASSLVRLGNVTGCSVIARVLWAPTVPLAALSFGEVVEPIAAILKPLAPASLLASYALIALACYVRIFLMWAERIKLNLSAVVGHGSEPPH